MALIVSLVLVSIHSRDIRSLSRAKDEVNKLIRNQLGSRALYTCGLFGSIYMLHSIPQHLSHKEGLGILKIACKHAISQSKEISVHGLYIREAGDLFHRHSLLCMTRPYFLIREFLFPSHTASFLM